MQDDFGNIDGFMTRLQDKHNAIMREHGDTLSKLTPTDLITVVCAGAVNVIMKSSTPAKGMEEMIDASSKIAMLLISERIPPGSAVSVLMWSTYMVIAGIERKGTMPTAGFDVDTLIKEAKRIANRKDKR